MKQIIENINSEIKLFAQEENALLEREFGKGIFDMPELAFVYEVGKRIARRRSTILGSEDYDWIRESQVGAGGITDLVFQPRSRKYLPTILLEFKMDDTYHKYADDIRKLNSLDSTGGKVIRLFVALKWLFTGTEKEFEQAMTKEFPLNALMYDSFTFPTAMPGDKPSVCFYSIWEVVEVGDDGFGHEETQEEQDAAVYQSYMSVMRNCSYSHEQALQHIGYSEEEFERVQKKFGVTK